MFLLIGKNSYLIAALSHASGVSTAGKLSVAKSTVSSCSSLDIPWTDDEIDCIIWKSSDKWISSISYSCVGVVDVISVSWRFCCFCCWLELLPRLLLERRTIVNAPCSVNNLEKKNVY